MEERWMVVRRGREADLTMNEDGFYADASVRKGRRAKG